MTKQGGGSTREFYPSGPRFTNTGGLTILRCVATKTSGAPPLNPAPLHHDVEFRVRYAETDQMGVVYHTNYLVWCEVGRTDFIRRRGMSYADIGRPVAWRLSFHGDSLFRVERVAGGRVAEWIDRSNPTRVRYRNEGSRRSLQLTITRTEEVPEFDASIWRIDR